MLYLISEYLVLCVDNNREIDQEILHFVIDEMVRFDKSVSYGKYRSFQSFIEGMMYGDGFEKPELSYNHTLRDNETFPLAILCDCLYVIRKTNTETGNKQFLERGARIAQDMMMNRVDWITQNSWIFQRGEWRDHIDYSYAGYEKMDDIVNGEFRYVEGIGEDTSHSRRLAVFIDSYARVSDNKQYYEKLKEAH